jgi:hypothetical protein
MATRREWTYGFLLQLGYPLTANNQIAVLTWIRSEWGSSIPLARLNPLNTILPYHESTAYNTVGVQNYVAYQDGIDAAVLTLLEDDHNYEPIRGCLAAGTPDLVAFLAAVSASDWGSHPTLDYLSYVQKHLDTELELSIGSLVFTDSEDDMLLSPTALGVGGRQPYAWLDKANKKVLLYNGASLAGDHSAGDIRYWSVPSNAAVQAMTRTRDPVTHLPDNRGIVVGAYDGGTFQTTWVK